MLDPLPTVVLDPDELDPDPDEPEELDDDDEDNEPDWLVVTVVTVELEPLPPLIVAPEDDPPPMFPILRIPDEPGTVPKRLSRLAIEPDDPDEPLVVVTVVDEPEVVYTSPNEILRESTATRSDV